MFHIEYILPQNLTIISVSQKTQNYQDNHLHLSIHRHLSDFCGL